MKRFRARDSDCPSCGRTPNVRFSPHQVRRCKRDRAAGHHTHVNCQRCGRSYWIRNLQIADGIAESPVRGNGRETTNGRRTRPRRSYRELPDDFPRVAALREAGIRTIREFDATEDLLSVSGVGPTTAAKMKEARARL